MTATSLHVSHESFTPQAKSRLFWLSVLALVSAGMMFAIRISIVKHLDTELFTGAAGEDLGTALGFAFIGFAASIMVSSPLLDRIGMGKALGLSALLMTVGVSLVIFVKSFDQAIGIEKALCGSLFVFGLGWGLVEAVINPLIATIHADDKTHKLNNLHAWWPAGLILGGLLGYFSDHGLGLSWRVQMAMPLVPTIVFGIAAVSMPFPATERKAAGIADADMFKQLTRPLFVIVFLCMFLTATSELAPGQLVDFALSQSAHMQGILLIVYVSALMFVMRHFGGTVAHKLSPTGLLWLSAILACIGLTLLSIADSPATAIGAATVWGTGVCFMWPTMLAMTSERFPRGGSLLLGLMGAAGMGSNLIALFWLGKVYDKYGNLSATAHGYKSFGALKAVAADPHNLKAHFDFTEAQISAGTHSFHANAMIPAVLIVVFALIWIYDRSQGGYPAVKARASLGEAIPSDHPVEAAPASVH